MQPPASYIRITDDPIEQVRERIDALPGIITTLFNEFKSFLTVVSTEQFKLKEKVIQMSEAEMTKTENYEKYLAKKMEESRTHSKKKKKKGKSNKKTT